MLPVNALLELRERPGGRPVMRQSWRSLTFLHIALPPAEVQAMLPKGLTVDTFPDETGEEKAWVGLVPFRMCGIRPRFAPALPWISAFPETNVRTYVHHQGSRPGVWFFSLDAARWLACRTARLWFGLPYWHAQMSVLESPEVIAYSSRRLEGPERCRLEAVVRPRGSPAPAEPGTLDFFLVERYLLYSLHKGALWSGRVWHPPYAISEVSVERCEQNLLDARGMAWRHAAFSPGVDVDVYGLQRV